MPSLMHEETKLDALIFNRDRFTVGSQVQMPSFQVEMR